MKGLLYLLLKWKLVIRQKFNKIIFTYQSGRAASMDLQTKKSKGLFKDLVSQNQRFWMEKLPNQPDQVEYESSVFIRKNKRLLGEFRLGWIGFSYPNLYLNKVADLYKSYIVKAYRRKAAKKSELSTYRILIATYLLMLSPNQNAPSNLR